MDDRSSRADVLIACVGDPSDPQTAALLRQSLAGVTDWEKLAASAVIHNMSGLLHRRVADLCPDAVASAVLEAWRTRSADVAIRSLRMQRELVMVLGVLAEAGVPALALKGATLSQQLYGDSTLRLFNDLDVLVRPESIRAARDVVIGLGYEDVHPLDASDKGLLELQRGEQEATFRRPRGDLLEVHWRIGPRFAEDSLSAEGLFERAGEVELLDRRFPCLGPLDVTLALSVHAATHEWLRIEDAAAMRAALSRLRGSESRELEVLASSSGCARRLHIGVLLVASLTRLPLPEDLQAACRLDRTAQRLASAAARRLVASLTNATGDADPGPLVRARGALWEARNLDTIRASARYAWRRLFVPALRDRSGGAEDARGPMAALTTQMRRQARLWRRDGR